MGQEAMIFAFWMLSFMPAFLLFSFIFINSLFSSSSFSFIRMIRILLNFKMLSQKTFLCPTPRNGSLPLWANAGALPGPQPSALSLWPLASCSTLTARDTQGSTGQSVPPTAPDALACPTSLLPKCIHHQACYTWHSLSVSAKRWKLSESRDFIFLTGISQAPGTVLGTWLVLNRHLLDEWIDLELLKHCLTPLRLESAKPQSRRINPWARAQKIKSLLFSLSLSKGATGKTPEEIPFQGKVSIKHKIKSGFRTSLPVQWLGIRLAMQRTPVQSLVQEEPTYLGATKPVCPEPVLCNKRNHCTIQLENSPCSLQLEETHVQLQRPSAGKN